MPAKVTLLGVARRATSAMAFFTPRLGTSGSTNAETPATRGEAVKVPDLALAF
jgi:hypothetical protein